MLKVIFNKDGYPMGQKVKLSLSIWRGLGVVETTPEKPEDQGIQIMDPCRIYHNVFFAGRMMSTRSGISASWAASWRKPGDAAASELAALAAKAAAYAAELTDEEERGSAIKEAADTAAQAVVSYGNPDPVVVIGRAPFNPTIEGVFSSWAWAPASNKAAIRAGLGLQFPNEKYVAQRGSGTPNWWGVFDPLAFTSFSEEEKEDEASVVAAAEEDPGFESGDDENVWWDGYRKTTTEEISVQHLRRPMEGHVRQMLQGLEHEKLPPPILTQGHLSIWEEIPILNYTTGFHGEQGNFYNHLFPSLVLSSPPWAIARGPGYILSPTHPPVLLLDRVYLVHHPIPARGLSGVD